MKSQFCPSTFLILGLLVMPAAFADADAEREALANIIHEIEALEPIIKRAKANTDKDSRISFRYDWLRQDLKQIRDGIQSHIDSPRAQPRSFPPLRGDYRR
jgi:RAQPRD family integrative conjugative element protein